MPSVQQPRGTLAALTALAAGGGLLPGQVYLLTDQSRLAVALTTTTFETFAKLSEASGGAGVNGVGAVTVPLGSYSHSEVIAAVGVVPSNAVIVVLGAFADEDENAVEFLDISAMSATAGTDQITVNMSFAVPTSGPINIIWSAI